MLRIVLATRNIGKVNEIEDKLRGYPVIIECLSDYPQIPEIEECGNSFRVNAVIKAKTVAEFTKLPALADDSGLEIDYLDGKPGIYSSRWGTNDRERIEKVVQALQNTTDKQRKARFVCVMSLVISDKQTYITKGTCSGKITLVPKGRFGFGYDPIFIPDGYTQTFAQLGSDIKNRISHRAMALRKMVYIIVEHYQISRR